MLPITFIVTPERVLMVRNSTMLYTSASKAPPNMMARVGPMFVAAYAVMALRDGGNNGGENRTLQG
eukprot:981792-Prorocentrum_minimum.AAC.1